MKFLYCLALSFALVGCGELDVPTVSRTVGGEPYNLNLRRPGDQEKYAAIGKRIQRTGNSEADRRRNAREMTKLYFLKDLPSITSNDLAYMARQSALGNKHATYALTVYYEALGDVAQDNHWSAIMSAQVSEEKKREAARARVAQQSQPVYQHSNQSSVEAAQRRELDRLIAEAQRTLGEYDDPIARGVREGMRTAVPMVRDAARAANRRNGGGGGSSGSVRPTTAWSNDASGIMRY